MAGISKKLKDAIDAAPPVAKAKPGDHRKPVFELEVLKALEQRLRDRALIDRETLEILRDFRDNHHESTSATRENTSVQRQLLGELKDLREELKRSNGRRKSAR